jgi:hypothetical protein
MKKILTLLLFINLLPQPVYANGNSQHHHHHSRFEIKSELDKPEINISVTKDAMAGWNLYIKVENFRFAPENITQKAQANEGHAHLYVDGKKAARIYGPWFHISGLDKSQHTIKVSLNANDHSELYFNGQAVAAEMVISP